MQLLITSGHENKFNINGAGVWCHGSAAFYPRINHWKIPEVWKRNECLSYAVFFFLWPLGGDKWQQHHSHRSGPQSQAGVWGRWVLPWCRKKTQLWPFRKGLERHDGVCNHAAGLTGRVNWIFSCHWLILINGGGKFSSLSMPLTDCNLHFHLLAGVSN